MHLFAGMKSRIIATAFAAFLASTGVAGAQVGQSLPGPGRRAAPATDRIDRQTSRVPPNQVIDAGELAAPGSALDPATTRVQASESRPIPSVEPPGSPIVNQSEIGSASAGAIANAQLILTGLGLYRGPIDGRMNGPTRAALRAYQSSARLPATGELDGRTAVALGATPDVASAQEQLVDLGLLGANQVSGLTDVSTQEAVARFQLSVGLAPTGQLDELTVQALQQGFLVAPPEIPTVTLPVDIPTVELP